MTPSTLLENIAAYDAMRAKLETEYMGKWVVFHNEQFVADYGSFEEAAADAVRKFQRGPYLIRQVGAPPRMHISPSLLFGTY